RTTSARIFSHWTAQSHCGWLVSRRSLGDLIEAPQLSQLWTQPSRGTGDQLRHSAAENDGWNHAQEARRDARFERADLVGRADEDLVDGGHATEQLPRNAQLQQGTTHHHAHHVERPA